MWNCQVWRGRRRVLLPAVQGPFNECLMRTQRSCNDCLMSECGSGVSRPAWWVEVVVKSRNPLPLFPLHRTPSLSPSAFPSLYFSPSLTPAVKTALDWLSHFLTHSLPPLPSADLAFDGVLASFSSERPRVKGFSFLACPTLDW